MNILEILVKLRDDLKTWVTNNLLVLKEEIEESKFSREYEDLFGKPDIDGKIENAIEPLENKLNELSTEIGEEVESLNTNFSSHKEKNDIHVSLAEKHRWDSKADSNHGTHLELGTTSDTAFRGDYGNLAHMHVQSTHAPVNAQKNSDITKAEIEAKLTGTITSHNHNGVYATKAEVEEIVTNMPSTSTEAFTNGMIDSAFSDVGL